MNLEGRLLRLPQTVVVGHRGRRAPQGRPNGAAHTCASPDAGDDLRRKLASAPVPFPSPCMWIGPRLRDYLSTPSGRPQDLRWTLRRAATSRRRTSPRSRSAERHTLTGSRGPVGFRTVAVRPRDPRPLLATTIDLASPGPGGAPAPPVGPRGTLGSSDASTGRSADRDACSRPPPRERRLFVARVLRDAFWSPARSDQRSAGEGRREGWSPEACPGLRIEEHAHAE